MQRGTIRSRARAYLNEATQNFYTNAELDNWINDAISILNTLARYAEVKRTLSTVAYQQVHSLPSKIHRQHIKKIYWEDDPLEYMDWETYINNIGADSVIDYGDPAQCLLSDNKLYLYPIPSASASQSTLNGAVNASVTSVVVDATTGFPEAGEFIVDSEVIHYTNKTATKFVGCSRGEEGTTVASHSDNALGTERDITIIAKGVATALTADTLSPSVDEDYHHALAYYVASIGHKKAKNFVESKEWERLWRESAEYFKRDIYNKRFGHTTIKDAGIHGYRRP